MMNTVAVSSQTVNVCPLTYGQVEHVWSYCGKICLATRHLMNAAANYRPLITLAGENFPNRIKHITTHLKLFSIVSVFFSVSDLALSALRIYKSILSNDKEGVALAALSFTIIAADMFDSVTTFVNAVLALISLPPVDSFVALGLPIAFVIAGLGTISRSIQVAKAFFQFRKSDDEDQKELHVTKMKVEGIGIAANLTIISGLTLFSIGAVTPVPYLLLATGFIIRISSLAYQDYLKSVTKKGRSL